MRLQAGGGDLAVAEPGEAGAVDVVGEDAAVGVGGGLGAVILQNVGQDLQGRRRRRGIRLPGHARLSVYAA